MEPDFAKRFNSCPVCGSKLRFCEELGKEVKGKGITRPNWEFHFDARSGPVLDKTKLGNILIGTSIPGYVIQTDICMDCGCLYAVLIARSEGKLAAGDGNNPLFS